MFPLFRQQWAARPGARVLRPASASTTTGVDRPRSRPQPALAPQARATSGRALGADSSSIRLALLLASCSMASAGCGAWPHAASDPAGLESFRCGSPEECQERAELVCGEQFEITSVPGSGRSGEGSLFSAPAGGGSEILGHSGALDPAAGLPDPRAELMVRCAHDPALFDRSPIAAPGKRFPPPE